jgi:PKD repeat protein/sugar lactone lactonase YvrE
MRMKNTILLGLLLGACSLGQSQTVSTYAGKQYIGSGKFIGTANNPLLDDYYSNPYGICVDTAGYIWLTDQHNVIILDGATSRQRGGYTLDPTEPGAIGRYRATGTQSNFNNPRGLFINPKTNSVYICDTDNGQIRSGTGFVNSSNPSIWDGLSKSNPDDDNAYAGKYTFLGDFLDGAKNAAYFSSPEDMVITSDGTAYVADYGNDCIRKISGNTVSTFAGKGLSTGSADGVGGNARFYAPAGICLEGTTNLLVADRNNGKIRRINLTTAQVTTVVSGLVSPSDVVSVDGLIFIADDYAIKVWDGTKLRLYAGKPGVSDFVDGNDSSARFGELGLMCYRSKDKSIYICDRENNVVRRIPIIQAAIPNFICNNTMPTVGQTVKLTNKSVFFNSVLWNITPSSYTIQGGGKLTDTVLYVTFNATGSYSVTLTAINASGSVPLTRTNYINVSTNSSAKPDVNFVAIKTNLVLADTAKLIDMSANTPNKWDWVITPRKLTYVGGTDSNSQFPKVKFAANGVYTVKLTATNSNGNGSLTKTGYIIVATSGLFDKPAVQFNVYPNPTQGLIFLPAFLKNETVSIVGADGKVVNRLITGNTLDISDLTDGVYVIKYASATGLNSATRIVKIH